MTKSQIEAILQVADSLNQVAYQLRKIADNRLIGTQQALQMLSKSLISTMSYVLANVSCFSSAHDVELRSLASIAFARFLGSLDTINEG